MLQSGIMKVYRASYTILLLLDESKYVSSNDGNAFFNTTNSME